MKNQNGNFSFKRNFISCAHCNWPQSLCQAGWLLILKHQDKMCLGALPTAYKLKLGVVKSKKLMGKTQKSHLEHAQTSFEKAEVTRLPRTQVGFRGPLCPFQSNPFSGCVIWSFEKQCWQHGKAMSFWKTQNPGIPQPAFQTLSTFESLGERFLLHPGHSETPWQ